QDKVFILVLASGSTGAAAAADYVRQVGVPTYNLYGSTPIIREPFAKNVFHGAVVPVQVSAAALISMFYDGGYTPKKFGILAVSTAIIPILGNADGIRGYYNAPAFPGQTPATREFEARLKKQLGSMPQGRPSVYDLIGYGSGYVVAEAIGATNCQLTRDNLINAWSNLRDAGPTPP